MNLLLHDGARILLAIVPKSSWFQLFRKVAIQHSSYAPNFLGVLELLDCNTLILVCYTVYLVFDRGKIRKGELGNHLICFQEVLIWAWGHWIPILLA
jgi:hypothetical protein